MLSAEIAAAARSHRLPLVEEIVCHNAIGEKAQEFEANTHQPVGLELLNASDTRSPIQKLICAKVLNCKIFRDNPRQFLGLPGKRIFPCR